MINSLDRIKYLSSSAMKQLTGWKSTCPYCKTNVKSATVVDRKYFFTRLVECPKCKMLVRIPTDDKVASKEFYQEQYSQEYTTDCPKPEVLEGLLNGGFIGTTRDYTRYINFFKFLGVKDGARVLDFGCSWGYGLYQLRKAGYNAEGFEVSVPRGRYGKEMMSLPIYSTIEELKGKYDVIFSSHVLEHLPDFTDINNLYKNQLADNGRFVAVTPNGSKDYRDASPVAFHQSWGKVHPVLLTDAFVKANYPAETIYLDSWEEAAPKFLEDGLATSPLSKFELVYALKPHS